MEIDCRFCALNFERRVKFPMLLGCGHNICKRCLDAILSSDQRDCPFCEAPFGTNIKRNYDLFSLIAPKPAVQARLLIKTELPANDAGSIIKENLPAALPANDAGSIIKESVPIVQNSEPVSTIAELTANNNPEIIAQNQMPLPTGLACSCGDPLFESDDILAEYPGQNPVRKCKFCKRNQDRGWFCKRHPYIICDDCYSWAEENKVVDNEQIVCIRKHRVRMTPNAEEANLRINRGDGTNILCDTCGERNKGQYAQCRECVYDSCRICVYKLKTILPLVSKLLCMQKHQLQWFPDYTIQKHGDFGCNVCKKRFKKSGSFNCSGCRYDLCISCAAKRIRSIQATLKK